MLSFVTVKAAVFFPNYTNVISLHQTAVCAASNKPWIIMVNVCPLTKFEGGLQSLHEAGDDAIYWLEFTAATALAKWKWICAV